MERATATPLAASLTTDPAPPSMTSAHFAAWLDASLAPRLEAPAAEWMVQAVARVEGGLQGAEFASLLSLASRYAPRRTLAPSREDLSAAAEQLAGWNPERWDVLEAVRVRLVLARPDLDGTAFAEDLEDAFRHGDEGELRALYKSLALLPNGERFAWRAAEGCRTNIVPVFEAVACDNPFPLSHFDDLAWNQMVIKALFIGAPVARIVGLDRRLNGELARMALDLVEERRSAGRPIQPDLWMCLGDQGGERGLESLERELAGSDTLARSAAVLGLARAGQEQRLRSVDAPELALALDLAQAGNVGRAAFQQVAQDFS